MSKLLRKSGSGNPLYLVIACEELRVFGTFEKLTEKISEFPDNIPGEVRMIFLC